MVDLVHQEEGSKKKQSDLSLEEFRPNYNLAPSESIPTLYWNNSEQQFHIDLWTWWLIPSWMREFDPKKAGSTFNAKGETIFERNSFQNAILKRRCEVVISGFLEWQYLSRSEKQPYLIRHSKSSILTLAGIYSLWSPKDALGKPLWDKAKYSVSIVTVQANPFMKQIHNHFKFNPKKSPRMPLILSPQDRKLWHNPKLNQKESIQNLIFSYHQSNRVPLSAYRVHKAIGNSQNKDPKLLEPIDGELFLSTS